MLDGITDFLMRLSQSGWPVLLVLALQFLSFRLLRSVGTQFQKVTNNHEAFDFQNKLTVNEIYTQLRDYTAASKAIYTRFFVADFFFPLFASLFLSLLWTLIFQRSGVTLFAQLLEWNVPLLTFLPAVFDWGENISFVVMISRYPNRVSGLASVAIAFKRLKLLTLILTILVTIGLLLVAAILIIRG